MRYQTAPRPEGLSRLILRRSGRPDSNRLRELGRLQCNQLHLARASADYRFGQRRQVCETHRSRDGSRGRVARYPRRMTLPRQSPTYSRAWAILAAAVALLAIVGATSAARE